MNKWQEIYNESISKGMSHDVAYKTATDEMNRRRSLIRPQSVDGMNETEAKSLLDEHGYSMRVINRGGGMTLDWRENRCNVRVDHEGNVSFVNMG